VPDSFCVHIIREGLINKAKLFLALKIMFPQGNLKLLKEHREKLMQICEIKDLRTLKNNLDYLENELNWLWFDTRTKNYNLRSFIVLCSINNLELNYGHKLNLLEVKNLDAWLGGVIFNICRLSIWRNQIKKFKDGQREWSVSNVEYFLIPQKGEGCVRRKGTTNKALSFSLLMFEPAPIALNYVSGFLSLEKSKVNRLKKLAIQKGYLKIEPCLTELDIPKENIKLYNQHSDAKGYVKIIDGKVMLVNSDLVEPTNLTKKSLKKRKY
jgi:hypothetical protein